jgi:hypothetical protein
MAMGVVDQLRRHALEMAIILSLFVVTVVIRLATTLAYPIEVGVDGAYYTIDVTSLLGHHYLYYDAPIVAFAVAAGFALLCGGNVIVGVKLASAVFGGLLNVGMYFAARTLSGGDWRAGLVAGALTAVDVSFFQMVTSLLKNEAALTFLPFALAFFFRFASNRRRSDLLGFMVAGTLVTLSHLMTAVWLFAALITYAGLDFLWHLKQKQWQVGFRQVLLPLCLGGFVFLGIYVALDFLIPSAPTWYTSSSLFKAAEYATSVQALSNVFGILASVQPYSSGVPTTVAVFQVLHIGTVGVFTLLGLGVCIARNKPADRAILALASCNALIGLLSGGWLIRFSLMFFVPAYILTGVGALVLIDKISGWLAERVKLSNGRWFSRRRIGGLFLVGLTFGVGALGIPNFLWTATNAIKPPVTTLDLEAIEAMHGLFPADVMLYAPQGTNYFITSRTGYEAQPDWGDSNWPAYCAKKMYLDITQADRPSYYVITPNNTGFFWAFTPLRNQLAEVITVEHFDLVDSALNVTVKALKSLYSVFCTLAYTGDSSVELTVMLAHTTGSYWSAVIDMSELPQGLFELFVGPQELPYSVPPPRKSGINSYIYHFKSLPQPQIHLSSLIRRVALPGAYQIYGVNITTARQVNLLSRAVEPPAATAELALPALDMYLIAPFVALSSGAGDISNFILLLVICPLSAMYWIGVSVAIVQLLSQGTNRLGQFLRRPGAKNRIRRGVREPERTGVYLRMVEPL